MQDRPRDTAEVGKEGKNVSGGEGTGRLAGIQRRAQEEDRRVGTCQFVESPSLGVNR